jgi:hypothetical protein
MVLGQPVDRSNKTIESADSRERRAKVLGNPPPGRRSSRESPQIGGLPR